MFRRSLGLALQKTGPLRRNLVQFINSTVIKPNTKMIKTITVDGYEALNNTLKEQSGKVYVLFSGSPNADGVSWCPDCVKGIFKAIT